MALNKEKNGKKKHNVRKVVLSVFAVLIILVLICGALKFLFFKESFIQPTALQVESAKSLVSESLQAKGDDISNYDIRFSERIKQSEDESDRNTLQVLLLGNSTSHSYLIDLDSGMIVMHMEKEIYGWMIDKCKGKEDKEESGKDNGKDDNSEKNFRDMRHFEKCDDW